MDDSSAHKAAKASRFCAIFVVVSLYFVSRGGTLAFVGGIGMLLMAPGFLLGIYALFGIRSYGAKGILAPALTGIAINGTLLFIFGSSFLAARAAAIAKANMVPGFNSADWTSVDANTPGSFKSDILSFNYPDSYELKKNNKTGQMVLRNANSTVVLTCIPKTDDMVETLKNQVSRMEPVLRKQSFTNFAQSDVEKVNGTTRSGNLIQMVYEDPTEGRLYTDFYILSAATNDISVLHIYSHKRKENAGPMFTKVLRSLTDGSSDVRQSAAPQVAVQNQSAAAAPVAATPVPTPTPTGPPELRKIMWISTKPSAQLDKDWAFEGDQVRGYKVTKISHDSVDLLTPEGAPLKLALAAQVAGK